MDVLEGLPDTAQDRSAGSQQCPVPHFPGHTVSASNLRITVTIPLPGRVFADRNIGKNGLSTTRIRHNANACR